MAETPKYGLKSTPAVVPDYNKIDFEGLNNYLLDIDFSPCMASNDVEFIWSHIKDHLCQGLDLFTPKVHLRAKRFPSWFTPEIKHLCNKIKSLKKSLKSRSTVKRDKILQLSQLLNHKVAVAKAAYEAHLVNTSEGNPSRIFRYLRSISQPSGIPTRMTYNSIPAETDQIIAESFNKYFFSVFNRQSPSTPASMCPLYDIQTVSFTESEVYNILSNLDPAKAKGIDGIGPTLQK
ncbi:PREDICTED: uncharacterized protein LOC109592761 [Amphimedon queenslandica]|uniref:Reverse transcriptase domain-containing protein n=1 Tax=Amphimedon queenslandica TaxID=400682 RepID=A0A1X7SJM6_AMPQE|nr:PREDICTED: uncharacterized protein LOC109592761 [Amphimedon queenslandica]|eukprot:XP_019863695.1 PREDICTED: uncharacterized protein LOC109592761 [Amphimedon queenslandica]